MQEINGNDDEESCSTSKQNKSDNILRNLINNNCDINSKSNYLTNNIENINSHLNMINDNNMHPLYINPKQFDTILKRRCKRIKINCFKNNFINFNNIYFNNGVVIKRKFKYKTRSEHAKNRERDNNGRFHKQSKEDVNKININKFRKLFQIEKK
jgi:hypothetical protein